MANPRFEAALRRMQATHDAKSHDYAREDNPYANFDFAAEVTARFAAPMDRVFATMVGIKLARLGELTSGKAPKHESIDDSFLDLANYVVLWWTQRQRLAEPRLSAGDEGLMERRTFDDIVEEAGRTSLYTRSTPYGHGV